MTKLQIGSYKTWRSFFVAAGYFWSSTFFAAAIRHETIWNGPLLFLVIMFFSPFISPFTRYFLFQVVGGSDFVLNYFLYKIKIPIKNIVSLSYEQRPAWRYLVLKYVDQNSKEVEKEWSIDFCDPINIIEMNESLKQQNPSIIISFDDKFSAFMEKQKDLHKKAPSSFLGWVWFALRWGGITAFLNIAVLYSMYYIDPSAFSNLVNS